MNEPKKGEIIIYEDKSKKASLEVRLEHESVWLTQAQIAQLFQTDRSSITKHIKNIVDSKELSPKSNVQFLHIANSDKPVRFYNLDFIISIGYRVSSKRATRFRVWATKVLHDHIIKGFTVNQSRLQETGLRDFEKTLALVRETMMKKELTSDEAQGLLRVITDYANTWLLLQKYDEDKLTVYGVKKKSAYTITYEDARTAIYELKKNLLSKKEAVDLFGVEREHLAGIIGNINQSFSGHALYPSIEEKAAHLLYFIIKDHPFGDGNKRIASLLFIIFLARNGHLVAKNGERKINDNALVALALLVAESKPNQKDVIVKIIINLLKDSQ